MNLYQLDFRKGDGGPIMRTEHYYARDDVEAVHLAGIHVGQHVLDLQCRKRPVKHFPAVIG
jgi:hypothetical protein